MILRPIDLDQIGVDELLVAYERWREKSTSSTTFKRIDGSREQFEEQMQDRAIVCTFVEMIHRRRPSWPPSIFVPGETKPDGTSRPIEVPACGVHLVSLAALIQFERGIHLPGCFYATSGRGLHDAYAAIETFLASNGQAVALKMDIRRFFENVLHDEVSRSLLDLGVSAGDADFALGLMTVDAVDQHNTERVVVRHVERGVAQGNPLSAFCSALLLRDLEHHLPGARELIVYVDDILAFFDDIASASSAFETLVTFLDALGLDLKLPAFEDCLVSADVASFEVLGRTFHRPKPASTISPIPSPSEERSEARGHASSPDDRERCRLPAPQESWGPTPILSTRSLSVNAEEVSDCGTEGSPLPKTCIGISLVAETESSDISSPTASPQSLNAHHLSRRSLSHESCPYVSRLCSLHVTPYALRHRRGLRESSNHGVVGPLVLGGESPAGKELQLDAPGRAVSDCTAPVGSRITEGVWLHAILAHSRSLSSNPSWRVELLPGPSTHVDGFDEALLVDMNRRNPGLDVAGSSEAALIFLDLVPERPIASAKAWPHRLRSLLRSARCHLGEAGVLSVRCSHDDFTTQAVVDDTLHGDVRPVLPSRLFDSVDAIPRVSDGCEYLVFERPSAVKHDRGVEDRPRRGDELLHGVASQPPALKHPWIRVESIRCGDGYGRFHEKFLIAASDRKHRLSTVGHPLTSGTCPRHRAATYRLVAEDVERQASKGVREVVIIHDHGFRSEYFVPPMANSSCWTPHKPDMAPEIRRLRQALERFDRAWFVLIPRKNRHRRPCHDDLLDAPRLDSGVPVVPTSPEPVAAPDKATAKGVLQMTVCRARFEPLSLGQKLRRLEQKRARASETRIAERWHGIETPNSGAVRRGRKADVDVPLGRDTLGLKVEAKYTRRDYYDLKLSTLQKVADEAAEEMRYPVLMVEISGKVEGLETRRLVVVPEPVLRQLQERAGTDTATYSHEHATSKQSIRLHRRRPPFLLDTRHEHEVLLLRFDDTSEGATSETFAIVAEPVFDEIVWALQHDRPCYAP